MGQGGAAPHHPAAAQDHGGVKEVGDEETVSGPDNLRRPSRRASAPQTQRRPGYAVHPRSAPSNQHLGELAEAAAHQRSRAGQPAIPLLLTSWTPWWRSSAPCCRRSSSTQGACPAVSVPAQRAQRPAQRVPVQRPAQRAPLAPPPRVRSAPFDYTWSRYNTNDKDDPRSRTTLPSRSCRRPGCSTLLVLASWAQRR